MAQGSHALISRRSVGCARARCYLQLSRSILPPGLSCLNVWRAPLHPLRRAKARRNRLNRLAAGWRTPAVVIVCGCLIAAVAFGPRSALGFFLTPLSSANHWGRDVFAFALAVQNLLWGAAQPVAGAIADRFGAVRVLSAGAILYAFGLVLMAHSSNAAMLDLSAGALIGFGLSGTTFPIVLAPSARYCRPNGARPLSISERRQALSVSSSFRRSLFS